MAHIYFGENLKSLREKRKLKQVEMLDEIGFTQTTWNNYEKEKSFPKFEDFIKISKYFDISLDNLVFTNLSLGGDLPKKKLHKIYSEGGDAGWDKGGDKPQIVVDRNGKALSKQDLMPYETLEMIAFERAATIADLRDTIKVLKDSNATLNALIQEMGKDENNSKALSAG